MNYNYRIEVQCSVLQSVHRIRKFHMWVSHVGSHAQKRVTLILVCMLQPRIQRLQPIVNGVNICQGRPSPLKHGRKSL